MSRLHHRVASCLAALCVCAVPALAAADRIDGVAAIVDDQIVLNSEVDLASALLLNRVGNGQPVPIELREQARLEALRTLIEAKLMVEFAERRDLAATAADVDNTIAGIAQDEGVEPATIYRAASEQGMTREAYRAELRNQITRMKVMQNIVRARITVTDAEVQDLFDERYTNQTPGMRVRVRHILIPWPDDPDPEKYERMREIAARIREKAIQSGAFSSLARQFSRAPSAADGGLTTLREGDVAPEIAEQVFGLPAGEVSPVIETPHGLNLFQILDRYDPTEIELLDVQQELRMELMERQVEPEYEEWMEELRKVHYIHIVTR
ncbi:MAG: peptidylprolyl isomerase [Deltaproteobacteria bacterium]|nr:peptidylprolyl isomerase [Deltaproteobacteria bacterium]MBW2415385.1 peptidylprolyl isomerase [Deltaproteobacteria bacterium]